MKKLLIITGPQGSGNHLWSKIFAATEQFYSWTALNNEYWVGHDQEPFAEAWHDPSKLSSIDTGNHDILITSISCPYAYHGTTIEPDYESFISAAEKLNYNIKIAIIGRDINVLHHQQQRVRNTISLPRFEKYLNFLCNYNPVFLSTELLYLYKLNYLKRISHDLGIEIILNDAKLMEILTPNANAKYFKPAEQQPLDLIVKRVSGLL